MQANYISKWSNDKANQTNPPRKANMKENVNPFEYNFMEFFSKKIETILLDCTRLEESVFEDECPNNEFYYRLGCVFSDIENLCDLSRKFIEAKDKLDAFEEEEEVK